MIKQLGQPALVLIVGIVPVTAKGQDSQTPKMALHGNFVKIDGQFAHVQGEMPVKGSAWFYKVEHRGTNLFVYSFWSINEFKDRKEKDYGFYRAQAWTVQVLDSKSHPEKEVIFDRLNDFYFWGNLVAGPEQAQVVISSIEGLPKSTYGPVALMVLK